MAKQNTNTILLIGAAVAAFFLFRRKASAKEVMTDEGTKVELDITKDDTGEDIPLVVSETESGKENFLSKVVPVVKSEAKKIITKVKAKKALKKATKVNKYKTLPTVKIKAKAGKKIIKKTKRSKVKGFDNMPVLY